MQFEGSQRNEGDGIEMKRFDESKGYIGTSIEQDDAELEALESEMINLYEAYPGEQQGNTRENSSTPRAKSLSNSTNFSRREREDGEVDEDDDIRSNENEGLLRATLRRVNDEGSARLENTAIGNLIKKGSGRLSAIANMSNAILGAGVIGLPYAFMQAGFFSGLVLLLIMGFATDWTLRLILYGAKRTGEHSYAGIMETCFGKTGRIMASFFQFVFAFGGMCAFGIIMGDTLPAVLRHIIPESWQWLVTRNSLIIVCTLCISYPLSLQRSMHELSWASTLALLSMVTIVSSVVIRTATPESMGGVPDSYRGDPGERWTIIEPTFFNAVGVISFAFVCHHNSMLIYASLSKPSMDTYAQVTHVSVAFSVISCVVLSLAGYLTFTNKTKGNLLNNFPEYDVLINVARFCFGANMFTTFPLETFVCREVIEQYFWPKEAFNKTRHFLITTGLVVVSLLIAVTSCNLSSALELVGGFSATSLAYIFPCATFLRLKKKKAFDFKSMEIVAAWGCVIFGIFAAAVCTMSAVIKLTSGKEEHVCTS